MSRRPALTQADIARPERDVLPFGALPRGLNRVEERGFEPDTLIEIGVRYERERNGAALSSAERRIEELVRERDGLLARLDNTGQAYSDQRALVTTLKAEVEELKREMTTWIEAGFKARADATAAESRLGEKRCRSN